jgi:hypothetical protein
MISRAGTINAQAVETAGMLPMMKTKKAFVSSRETASKGWRNNHAGDSQYNKRKGGKKAEGIKAIMPNAYR